ncbi:MAG: hypothetical protein IPH37_18550 [Burkholderiales bacterium]|nr:hypothetical protein [Burkholderiales bacterium]MBK9347748.1 hypothetical protein [Burkholderiales bacterium]
MEWFSQNQQQSRLGQILVKKKLISDEQLKNAIARQASTGERLGDILTEWNVVTNQHILAALRAQRNLRLAASLVTALMAPLQAYAATPEPVTQSTQQDTAEKPKKTMTAMTDADMDGISAQGLNNELLEVITKDHTGKGDGVEVLGKMAKLMNPLLAFLEADTSMKDVVYDPATAAAVVNPDGSITLSLPSSIGEISFKNIRPVAAGSIGGPSMGSITLRDIQFNNTKITLTHRP